MRVYSKSNCSLRQALSVLSSASSCGTNPTKSCHCCAVIEPVWRLISTSSWIKITVGTAVTAFFFAILHLGMLVLATGTLDVKMIPYLVGLVLALIALILG